MDFQLFRTAFMAILPLSIAVLPWGVLTGALAVQAGFTPIQAQCLSLIVFAGAAQLSGISLFGIATTSGILVSTFVISSRHLLYSLVMRQHIIGLSLPWRLTLGFLLTDESFAVSQVHTRSSGSFSPLFALIAGLTFYLFWNAATLFGIVIGETVAGLEELGLDFAIVATFIAMTFEEIRRKPVLAAIFVSGLSVVVLSPVVGESAIVVAALLGMTAAYIVDDRPFTQPQNAQSEEGDNRSDGPVSRQA